MAYEGHRFDRASPVTARQYAGCRAHHAGQSAEDQVARHYAARGHEVIARRWRAGRGEIDLVMNGPEGVIFVEVKQSRSFDAALARITPAKAQRLFSTAGLFLDTLPQGAMTESRFDVALVNGSGEIAVHENFFGGGI